MKYRKIPNCLVSINLILSLIFIGIIGGLTFECVNDNSFVSAKSIIVSQFGGGDYYTIQEAIDYATSGDTIHVWAGTYYEKIIVNKTVTLIGNGSKETVIDGGGSGTVVKITTN